MKTIRSFLLVATAVVFMTLSPVACASTTQGFVVGQTATLWLTTCNGTQPFTFQWYKNGTAIAGATGVALPTGVTGIANSALVLTPLQASDAATYTVVITNAAGSTTSDQAILTLTIAPSGAVTGGTVTKASGS